MDIPVQKIFYFSEEPSGEDLAVRIVVRTSSSNTQAIDETRAFRIAPGPKPPMWFIYAIMTFVLVGGIVMVCLFTPPPERWFFAGGIAICGTVAAWSTVEIVKWMITLEGRKDYVVIEHVTDEVTLPRLGVAFPKSSVTRVVEGVCKDGPNQLMILLRNAPGSSTDRQWVYAYVFSPHGNRDRLVPKLAEALAVNVDRIDIED